MEISNLCLSYLLLELKPLIEGARIQKIQQVSDSDIKIRLYTKQGSKTLIVGKEALFFSDYKITVINNSGFSAFLKKHIQGKKIISIKQHNLDRIAEIELQDYFLILELFSEGNIILTDKDKKILQPFHIQKWKDRVLRKGETYKYPESKPSVLEAEEKEFIAKSKTSEEDIFHFIIRNYNLSPLHAEDCLLKAKIEKKEKSKNTEEKKLKLLLKTLKETYSASKRKAFPSTAEKNGKQYLVPVKISVTKQKKIKNLNNFLEENYLAPAKTEESREKKSLSYSLEKQKVAKKMLESKAKDFEEKANKLYEFSVKIQEITEAINKGKEKKFSEKEIEQQILKNSNIVSEMDLKKKKLLLDL